jgi:hypothetical protein
MSAAGRPREMAGDMSRKAGRSPFADRDRSRPVRIERQRGNLALDLMIISAAAPHLVKR